MAKQTRRKPKLPPPWNGYDILSLQICLCILLGAGAWLGIRPFCHWQQLFQSPALTFNLPREGELLDAVETFLNGYIWQEEAGENSPLSVTQACQLSPRGEPFLPPLERSAPAEAPPAGDTARRGIAPIPDEHEAGVPKCESLVSRDGVTAGDGEVKNPTVAVLPSGGAPGDNSNSSSAPVTSSYDLTAPLSGTVTSPFGERSHPISGEADFHKGLDIAAEEGTPIHAIADGVVLSAGWDDSYGYNLTLRHSDNFSSRYAHCSRLIAREGDVIRRGERIAAVGSTGLSTGPHVHLDCVVEGVYVNPLWLI